MQRVDVRSPRTARLAAIAGSLAVALFVGAARADEIDDVVARAEALRAGGDAPGAIALLRPLADDPKTSADPRVEAALGEALLVHGDPADAAVAFRAVVRARPEARNRLRLATALLATAKARIAGGARLSLHVVPYLEDAVSEARSAGTSTPDLTRDFAAVTAEAELLLGRPAAARAALEAPSIVRDARADDLLARACYALSDFAAAAEAWGRAGNTEAQASAWAAARDPRAIPWYAASALTHWNDAAIGDQAIRGAAYVDGGDGFDAALLAGLSGADVAPEKRAAIERLRGRLAERRGRYRDAVERYRAVAAARADDWEADRDLARALFALSTDDPVTRDEAIRLYQKVIATHPDDADTRAGLGWQARLDATDAHRAWPDHARLDRAIGIFRTLAETAPDDGLAWTQYGNAARIGGASDASLAAFERATALHAFDASTWNDRGIALLAAGRRDAALESFEHAIALDAGDTSSRQNAARQHRLAGRDDEADAHLAAALRTARAVGGQASLYRALIDRGLRARRRPELR